MGWILVKKANIMRRYWITKSQIQGDHVLFQGEQFHHIFEVCRQDVGSKFEVITEDSVAYFVQVDSVARKNATALIQEKREIKALENPLIELVLSVSRFPVMDAIMEKAVEMGVHQIHPVTSDFSFLRKEDGISENKIERWKKIIISATQQSGRGDLMKLATVTTLDQKLQEINLAPNPWGLFCYEGQSTLSIKNSLTSKKVTQPGPPERIWAFIGSEGGFSESEVQSFIKLGLGPVTLGSQVLRVETACIAVVSVLKYEFDLMR